MVPSSFFGHLTLVISHIRKKMKNTKHITLAIIFCLVGSSQPVFAQDAGIEWNKLSLETIKLYREGRYSKATLVAEQALTVAKENVGPEHPDVATSLINLALLYYTQGHYAKAEPLYKRALEIREKALGPDHPNVATSLNNLAHLYRATKRNKEASGLDKRAKQIRAIKR
jgi:tetratricopeptide (TPR) repeat protein